jgi:hypothetical protein
VTPDEIVRLIAQYRAGIDAELSLLHQLSDVSTRQRTLTSARDFAAFNAASDDRDALMRGLVTLEEGLREVRAALTEHRALAERIQGFDAVVARHREAAALVSTILSADQASMSALADAELARRTALVSLERGETTLAAYRRVLAPPVASATLVNRRG